MVRTCGDCGLPYEPKARNQKRCTPCRALREVEYWAERGGVPAEVPAEPAGLCGCCGGTDTPLAAGASVCVDCVAKGTPAERRAALEQLHSAFADRRQYATMPPDPVLPRRGSAAYAVLSDRLWDAKPQSALAAIQHADAELRALCGGVEAPRYLVLAAALAAPVRYPSGGAARP